MTRLLKSLDIFQFDLKCENAGSDQLLTFSKLLKPITAVRVLLLEYHVFILIQARICTKLGLKYEYFINR